MYKITYEDGTTFMGGNVPQSKWNEIEDKPIKKIEYVLGSHKVEMSDYGMYNHQFEEGVLYGRGHYINNIVLMGLNGMVVTSIIFNRKEHCIEERKSLLGHEYEGKLTTGWKKGIKGKVGFFKLFEKNC